MSLSLRDRVKVHAGLVLLRDAGADIGAVTRMAEAGMNNGTPARLAYEAAFNAFVAGNSTFHGPLMRLGQVVEATDDRTVAGYGVALDRYVATGDHAMLQSVMPSLQADMGELAARTGDAGFADGLGNAATMTAQTEHGSPAPSPQPSAGSSTQGRSGPGWGPTGYVPSQDTTRHPEAGG